MKDAVYIIGIPIWFVGHCQCHSLNTNLIILKGSFIIENNQLLCQYNHRNPICFYLVLQYSDKVGNESKGCQLEKAN